MTTKNTTYQNLLDAVKEVFREKGTAFNVYIRRGFGKPFPLGQIWCVACLLWPVS